MIGGDGMWWVKSLDYLRALTKMGIYFCISPNILPLASLLECTAKLTALPSTNPQAKNVVMEYLLSIGKISLLGCSGLPRCLLNVLIYDFICSLTMTVHVTSFTAGACH
jgi:hypothetical protein